MASLWIVLCMVCVAVVSGIPLKQRVAFLESKLRELTYKDFQTEATITDIAADVSVLNETIQSLEQRCGCDVSNGQSQQVVAGNNAVGQVTQHAIDLLNERLDEQEHEMSVLRKAVRDEKAHSRSIAKLIAQTQAEAMESITANISAMVKQESCPPMWLKVDGVYFTQPSGSVTFDQAKERCEQLGGRLFEPDTELKQASVTEDNVWVGATDQNHDGKWIWLSSGNELKSIPWYDSQPNNSGGKQWCMEAFQKKYNDEDCDTTNMYMCQKELN